MFIIKILPKNNIRNYNEKASEKFLFMLTLWKTDFEDIIDLLESIRAS
jgi:hypothetical protein